ncbi:MAG: deoxyribodipyrimidine photo-lyase [Arthrobacter sp.]|uniref:cryptochrome/photolyase family protein n=1 Tax=Arthrobacter sp. TaxID=1667 RepID=UPI00346AE7F2
MASIVWFRDDLRVADNPALLAAWHDGDAVALFVLDEQSDGIRPLGAAAKWWLHHGLESLRADLGALGIPLLLRRGPAGAAVAEAVESTGAASLYWNRRYGGPERAVDASLKEWASSADVHAESFQASLLHEPWTVKTGQGNPYQVFTPFWRTVSALDFRAPLGAPEPGAARTQGGDSRGSGSRDSGPSDDGDHDAGRRGTPEPGDLDDLELLPTRPDWSAGLADAWTPGEAAAHEVLADFLEGPVRDYADGRDRPDRNGTSRLSPYLRWGHLSPFQVWAELAQRRREAGDGGSVFAAELGWREFCWHQLFHHPDLATVNLRPDFDAFPWERPREPGSATPAILRAHASGGDGSSGGGSAGGENAAGGGAAAGGGDSAAPPAPRGDGTDPVDAWKAGLTGIPLVDAGQRQLWHTGWMHSRVRMVSASFLVKNLGVHWRVGEEWFWETLVDADAASNPASWQWVAGSGADAAPFFRIFNPQTQAKKFDPDGLYVARWAPDALTPSYPEPLVDLKESRQRALDAYATIR